jgi:hypothetical protein
MAIYNKDTKQYSISGYSNYAWSASKNVFYLITDLITYVRAGNWPDDAVEVSDDVFNEFATFQNRNGMIRGVGSDGLPTWVTPPEPSKELLIRNAEANRNTLTAKASVEIDILTDAESDGTITDEKKNYWRNGKHIALRYVDLI